MIPFMHKFNVISRIALISRYGPHKQRSHASTRPIALGLHDQFARDVHTSPPVQMARLTEEPVVDVMQKLQNSPEAMVAVTKFLQVAHKEGFGDTLMSGRMPSRIELFKLYSNPTMRKAAESMVEALTSAGIEFDQETAMKLVKNLPEMHDNEESEKK